MPPALGTGADLWQLNDQNGGSPGLWFDPTTGIRIDGWTALMQEGNALAKQDPVVSNNAAIVNTLSVPQKIIAQVSLDIPPFAYNQVVNSSIGVSITDSITGIGLTTGASLSPFVGQQSLSVYHGQ